MMFYARLFIILLSLNSGAFALPAPQSDACAERRTVDQIEKLIKQEMSFQDKLDERLSDSLIESLSEPANLQNSELDKALKELHEKIETSYENYLENRLRVSFLSDLKDKVMAKHVCVLRPELPEILMSMAKRELVSCSEAGRTSKECRSWKFMTNLALVIKDSYEINEDFGDFLKSFISYSSLSEPKAPGAFIKGRAYIGK